MKSDDPIRPATQNVRNFRERMRERGLIKRELWIRPEHAVELAALEKAMREPGRVAGMPLQADAPAAGAPAWTLESLEQALRATAGAQAGQFAVERIEGAEPTLRLTVHDHGDLALLLAVSGEQILVEAFLWPVSAVSDPAAFNAFVLQAHKYLPLSTFSLSTVAGEPGYTLFGALDAHSSLASLLLEIQSLADNVLAVVDLCAEHLRDASLLDAGDAA